MENENKKKDAAVDKVEKIVDNGAKKSTDDKSFEKAQNVKKQTAGKQPAKKQSGRGKKKSGNAKAKVTAEKARTEKAEKKLKERQAKKAARVAAEKEKRERRRVKAEEKAKATAEAKQAKQKKIRAAKIAKKRKAESVKALKIQKREERLAKKEALKHESKEERQKRLAAEKQAKIKIRADKAAAKADLKKKKSERKTEKNRLKAERRAEVARMKTERKAEKSKAKNTRKSERQKTRAKRGIGGWLAAVISLGCAVLILGSLLTVQFIGVGSGSHPAMNASANTARNFYDFVGYVDGMETDMSKVFVSTDNGGRQKILTELSLKSNLAGSALAQLPIADESKYYTSKYINQVGDYAKYLNNRLINGDGLTKDDLDNLQKLYEINVNLKSALSTLAAGVGENYDFKNLAENNANDLIVKQFNELEKSAVDYPQMIYDGPFSDGLDAIEPKGLDGEEISKMQAEENFNRDFASYGIKKIIETSAVENTKIDCYSVIAETEEGGDVAAQYTVKGGKLLSFLARKECADTEIDEDAAERSAEEFLAAAGFKNMKRVWRYETDGVEYFNYAYVHDGAIVYPDLVKLTVCRETGRVTGMDAEEYYLNHTERGKFTAKYSITQAEEKVNDTLLVSGRNRAITPIGNGKETVAYEFIGTYEGDTYYVFVDANTLKEIKIYKAVDTDEGRLLI